MLLILIPTAWLSAIALVAILCRMAALGDAPRSAPAGERSLAAIGERIVLSPRPIRLAPQIRRPSGHTPGSHPVRRPAARRRLPAHGLR